LKDFPQTLHSNSLLFSCDSKCLTYSYFLFNLFSQILHLNSRVLLRAPKMIFARK
jgi:hypothetical protein